MDEFFETLTLRQTGKIKKNLPIVLFGTEYWDRVLNVDAMLEWGTISEKDLLLFHRSDTVEDAFSFLVDAIEQNEREGR
jgi:predicted Rossmann-fold nucleotide-binding protein